MTSTMTSMSHPLRIAEVIPRTASGTIGMTLLPGRKGQAGSGVWERDLAVDLEAVRAWKPDLVVALLEDYEFAAHGVADFKDAVARAGLPWSFVAIADGGVPDAAFLERWEALRPRADRILREGGRVLIHCKAGLGRTGTLAAMLLIDFGDEPETAIERVREARSPDAIESGQERFVRRYRGANASGDDERAAK